MDDEVLSGYLESRLGAGSCIATQSVLCPSDETVRVKNGPEPNIWETHRPICLIFISVLGE